VTWRLPDPNIFEVSPANRDDDLEAQLDRVGHQLTEKLDELGSRCEVERVVVGAQIVRFEMVPAEGTLLRSLPRLAPELAYEVAAESVRIVAPIPGKRLVGIEVPTPVRRRVLLGDVLSVASAPLQASLGVDIEGNRLAMNLIDAPHVLVAGQTGGGKSVLLNTMLCSLLARATPDELALVLIDPKQVEMTPYEGLPHLLLPIADNARDAIRRLKVLVRLMDEHLYPMMAENDVRSLAELHEKLPDKKHENPYILCVIDELADLMLVARQEVEELIVRLAQKGRAAGIHLLVATQSPRATVVTGMIRANMPAKIALSVSSAVDSRVILERSGAESLLGAGDALLLAGSALQPTRIQCAYTSSQDIDAIVNWWKAQWQEQIDATAEALAA